MRLKVSRSLKIIQVYATTSASDEEELARGVTTNKTVKFSNVEFISILRVVEVLNEKGYRKFYIESAQFAGTIFYYSLTG